MTQDDLKLYGLQLFQPRQGYRYSLDALLLAHFCAAVQPGGSIIDLGAGCGIISLVLSRVNPAASVVAVENNPEMAALVERNIQHNDLCGSVSVRADDVVNLRKNYADSIFDLVASNPPFRTPWSGKVSPHAGRDVARHESTAGIADFLAMAKYLVKPSGRICFVYHPDRLAEFISCAGAQNLALLRLRMVHGSLAAPARIFLAELAKGSKGSPTVLPPLIVHDSDGGYTSEIKTMLAE